MKPKTVLVLDIFDQTLAVVRSLSRAGFHVVLGRPSNTPKSVAERSRHCHEVWIHPNFSDATAFDDALGALLDQRPELQTIFPVAEPSTRALMAVTCLRGRSVDVAMVPKGLFSACYDKAQGHKLAAKAGLAVPESRIVGNIDSLQRSAESIGFPLVVKSPRSAGRVYGRKAYIVESQSELKNVFAQWPSEHDDLLVQRFIDGSLESSDFVASDGDLVGYLESRILRTDMPDGTGGAVEFISIPPTPDVLGAVRAFIRVNNYSGPGVIQFVRDSQSGQLFFIETNPRLGAGVAHSIDAGMDCPLLTVRSTARVGESPAEFNPDRAPYRYGYRVYWLRRDVDRWVSLWSELRFKQHVEWLLRMVRSLVLSEGHIYWRWRDPYPAICIYAEYVHRAIVDPIASRIRDLTPKEVVIEFTCSVFRRLMRLRVLRVITLEPADVSEEFDLAELPLRGAAIKGDEIPSLIDTHPALSEQFLARAREKEDWCYAIFNEERLASFGWYSERPTRVSEPFDFEYPKDFLYMYHGFTDSQYRGLRLHGFGLAQGARIAQRQGKRGLIGLVEAQNHASVRSATRIGFQNLGTLLEFKLGPRWYAVRSPGCRRAECALVPRAASDAVMRQ